MKKWLIVALAAVGAATQAGLLPVVLLPVAQVLGGLLGVPVATPFAS